ncbi:MAG: T9SS type A sorting domain-containing protein [Bacteroidetes bacterium]|nr:MAG: T9SS type A sorting domain-containing protein [Bacteroidota bacterium]
MIEFIIKICREYFYTKSNENAIFGLKLLTRFKSVFVFLILFFPALNLYSQNYILSPYENIINGDFSQGNRGFFTDYFYSATDLTLEGNYTITSKPKAIYDSLADCSDHTPGSDSLMLVLNGYVFTDIVCWGDTIRNIIPNNDYVFSFWAQSCYHKDPANLEVRINGNIIGYLYLTAAVCRWDSVAFIWNSGAIRTAVITIIDTVTKAGGNDFAIDDISFRAVCSVQADAGPDLVLCEGQTAQIGRIPSKGVPPFQYSWQPSAGLNNPNIATPTVSVNDTTTYYLTVTDSLNCVSNDTVEVKIIPFPNRLITTDKPTTICACDSVQLTAPLGDSYLWTTGDTTRSIYVNQQGNYSVKVNNNNLCYVDIDTTVNVLNTSTVIQLDTVYANIGEKVVVPMHIISPLEPNCSLGQYDAAISYNKSILVPTGNTPKGTINGDYEVINVSDKATGRQLMNFEFIAVLGNTECTDINLMNFKWNCGQIKVDTISGRFCLKNLCKSPNVRLFDDKSILYLRQARPNPASVDIKVDFGLIEEGETTLEIYNFFGQKISELFDENLKPGQYFKEFNIENFQSGSYILKLQTPNNSLYKTLQIIH